MSPSPPIQLPSKGQINRCGQMLAAAHRDGSAGRDYSFDALSDAYAVVSAYRTAHQAPMSKVAMGLRSMVRTATAQEPLVSQRLKRVPRIIRKLARMEDSMLARLEDIGGCRAVVGDAVQLERVRLRIESNWGATITRRRDYLATPNHMGYRALHFTVPRDGRRIEVQLRTRGQQAWANAIEAADSSNNLTLKDGVGPESMMEYFSAAGDYIYHQEYQLFVPDELRDRLDSATDRVIGEGYYSRREPG